MAGTRSPDLPLLLLLAACLCPACAGGGGAEPATAPPQPRPPAACAAAWADEAASGLVDALTAATVPGPPVWTGYGLEDGTYVLVAGEAEGGGTCLGAWRGGQALGYAVSGVEPNVLTPLYGYLLPWEGNGGPFDPLVEAYRQPPEVAALLADLGVESAVVMPVHAERFPIELPPVEMARLAVHEAFHVEVEMPRWVGPGSDWPVWDLQPDRGALPACYTRSAEVEAAFAAERQALDRLVNALLDDHRAAACAAGREFLHRRERRYEMLSDQRVDDHAGRPGTCRAAEAVMELEEGVADFASWVQLYHRGVASRDRLMQRYRATQKELFYLTGAMQAHALYLLDPDGWLALSAEIAASPTPDEGSLTTLLRRELEAACGQAPFPTLDALDAALARLESGGAGADVDAFWRRVEAAGAMPLVFGDTAVFLYRGAAERLEWRGGFSGWDAEHAAAGRRVGDTDARGPPLRRPQPTGVSAEALSRQGRSQ